MRIFSLLAVLFGLLSLPQKLTAGTVTKVDEKKKIITVDEGKEQGLAKGAEICFNDEAGKKITCGMVKTVKAKSATVKVKSKKALKKIKVGTTAVASAPGTALAGSASAPTTTPTAPGAVAAKFMAIRLFYLYDIKAPAAYNNMNYLAPTAEGDVESLWDKSSTTEKGKINFGVEFDLVALNVAIGLRPYRLYQPLEPEADYVRTANNPYFAGDLSATAQGIYFDYNIFHPKAAGSGLRLGAGIDVDISTVKYEASEASDGSDVKNPLYSITSQLTVISLRLPVGYDLNLGSMGLNVGANILIPVAGDKPASTIDVKDPNKSRYAGSEEEKEAAATADIIKNLGHKKSSFAAELSIGTYYSF